MTSNLPAALRMFNAARDYVSRAELLDEVEWQRQVSIEEFTETDLLREAAWVVLCSGFREKLVRGVFDYLSLCFCDWESAKVIVDTDPTCRNAAKVAFRNSAKLAAISGSAELIYTRGFAEVKRAILRDPIPELQRFPYIGPVTARHLAKNLGLNVAKPDRHLVRIADHLGFGCADDLCHAIADATGEPIKVVDLMVWRYLADNPGAWIGTENCTRVHAVGDHPVRPAARKRASQFRG